MYEARNVWMDADWPLIWCIGPGLTLSVMSCESCLSFTARNFSAFRSFLSQWTVRFRFIPLTPLSTSFFYRGNRLVDYWLMADGQHHRPASQWPISRYAISALKTLWIKDLTRWGSSTLGWTTLSSVTLQQLDWRYIVATIGEFVRH